MNADEYNTVEDRRKVLIITRMDFSFGELITITI